MSTDDLKQHATSSEDFYALLGVDIDVSKADLRRAYRKTALKFHPDKNPDNPDAAEKFHLLTIAHDVLSDPAVKALYDNARAARVQKQKQHEAFEGRRRQMKEDLERREGGVKRKRDEGADAEEKLEREIRRIAEDNKRRRKEREEMLSRERLEEEERLDNQRTTPTDEKAQNGAPQGVAEINRTVKVRWAREGSGADVDAQKLQGIFSRFGKIENTFLLKDKKDKKNKKRMMATGVLVYTSVVGAYAAVEDFPMKSSNGDLKQFESVAWASGAKQSPPSTPMSTPSSTPKRRHFPGVNSPFGNGSLPSTPAPAGGLRKVPSFASFSGSPFAKGSPSFEESVLMRLRAAEKKKLEDQIRKEEKTADSP